MYVLTVRPDTVRVPVEPGATLDRALHAAGMVRPRRGCRRGGCGMCMVRLDAGTTVDERPIATTVLSGAQRADRMVLPCRAVPTSDVEITLLSGSLRCVSPLQRALADRHLAAHLVSTASATGGH